MGVPEEDDINPFRSSYEELLEYIHNLSLYSRPDGPISKPFMRALGPLPAEMKDSEIGDEEREVMNALPSYKLLSIGLLIAVLASIYWLVSLFPRVMLISPLSLFFSLFQSETVDAGKYSTYVISILVIIMAALAVSIYLIMGRNRSWSFIANLAHEEEKMFRAGAESWTTRQKTMSCVSYGGFYVLNLFYPVAALITLSGAGWIFMAVYLYEYRQTGDGHRALLASTKAHAQYNIYAITLVVVIVCAVAMKSVFSLL